MVKKGTETDMMGAYDLMVAGKTMSFKQDTFKFSGGLKIWNKRANKWLPCERSLNSLMGAWWEVEVKDDKVYYKQKNSERISFKQAWGYMQIGVVYSFNNTVLKYDKGLKGLSDGHWVSCHTTLDLLVNSWGFEMERC